MSDREIIKVLSEIRDYLTAGNPIWDTDMLEETMNVAISAVEENEEVKRTGQVVVNMSLDEDALKRTAFKIIEENDVVKVVRCKDCKYLKPFTSQYGSGQYCECPCSFGGQGIKKPDDYCSYGEQRDDREYKDSIINARKGEE